MLSTERTEYYVDASFLFRFETTWNMSLSRSLEEIKHFRKQTLEPALKSLHEKNSHIKQVYEYCTDSYVNANGQNEKKQVERETMKYLIDLMTALSGELEGTSEVILNYLDMTVDLAEKVSSREMGKGNRA
jgi:hypothetical protein